MIPDDVREKLQNIIRGELQKGRTDSCTAIWNFLCKSFGTSPTVKGEFESKAIIKKEQIGILKSHAQNESLWLESLPSDSHYLTEFIEIDEKLFAVVQQPFVEGDQAS